MLTILIPSKIYFLEFSLEYHLIDIEKRRGCNFYIFSDGTEKSSKNISREIRVICSNCGKAKDIKLYGGKHSPLNKPYSCPSCNNKGKNNPFYGKTHTNESKKKMSDSTNHKGKNNPFYGKTHTEETKNKIKKTFEINGTIKGKNNPFYGKTHTEETKNKIKKAGKLWRDRLTEEDKKNISKVLSNKQNEIKNRDPEYYSKIKVKAAKESHRSQFRNMSPNKIEIIIENELKNRNINMDYSVIFCHKQFDFGNKKHRILLEVQGDYWHGNPNLFNETGNDSKKKLNYIQKRKIQADLEKKDIAEKYGFKLFYIWEQEIFNNDFRVLDQIKEIINNATN